MAGRRARGARRSPPRSQHFLSSRKLAAELVRDAQIEPGDVVLDIGAGRGRLTEEIARVAARVVAIEVDSKHARALEGRWSDAGVLARRRRTPPLVEACEATEYRRFVATAFRRGVRHANPGRRELSLERRLPRDLDAHEWARLFNGAGLGS